MKPCPICDARIKDVDFTPFCSKRCAVIDLGRWIKGSYAIPASTPDFTDVSAQPDNDSEPSET